MMNERKLDILMVQRDEKIRQLIEKYYRMWVGDREQPEASQMNEERQGNGNLYNQEG